jgi:hypothetical protein
MRAAQARADRSHSCDRTSNLINIGSSALEHQPAGHPATAPAGLQSRGISALIPTAFRELTSLHQTSNRSESAATNLA